MTHELTTLGSDPEIHGEPHLVLRFVVKKIKVKAYVYLHGRDEHGQIKTIYVGPLEEIAKFYLTYKKSVNMAPGRGLEPPTTGLTARRSTG